MTIEYALTRTEVVQGYFQSLRSSPRFSATILLYAVGMGGIVLLERGALTRHLTLVDAITALLAAGGMMLFLPVILFIRAKTSKRSLTVSPDGISTEIGSLKGLVSWKKIRVISETDRYVLIARTTGNAFFIPGRAFSNAQQQAEFVTKIRGWTNAAGVA